MPTSAKSPNISTPRAARAANRTHGTGKETPDPIRSVVDCRTEPQRAAGYSQITTDAAALQLWHLFDKRRDTACRPVQPQSATLGAGTEGHFRQTGRTVDSGADIAWFHAASLGEFEQGRPVIEAFRKACPGYKILVTFFSPSGYEIRKNYPGADYIFTCRPTPRATCAVSWRSCGLKSPFFVKYEFWVNYLLAMKRAGTKLYLISSIFRDGQIFFRPLRRTFPQRAESFPAYLRPKRLFAKFAEKHRHRAGQCGGRHPLRPGIRNRAASETATRNRTVRGRRSGIYRRQHMAARRRIVSGIDRTVSGRGNSSSRRTKSIPHGSKSSAAYSRPALRYTQLTPQKRSRRSGRLVRRYDRDPVVRLPLRPLGIHRRRFRRRDTQYAGSGHAWTAAGFRTPVAGNSGRHAIW